MSGSPIFCNRWRKSSRKATNAPGWLTPAACRGRLRQDGTQSSHPVRNGNSSLMFPFQRVPCRPAACPRHHRHRMSTAMLGVSPCVDTRERPGAGPQSANICVYMDVWKVPRLRDMRAHSMPAGRNVPGGPGAPPGARANSAAIPRAAHNFRPARRKDGAASGYAGRPG